MSEEEKNHEVPLTAFAVLINDDDEVLIMRRTPNKRYGEKFTVPGGHMDAGENVLLAAVRELKEETGIETKVEDCDVLGVLHTNFHKEYMHFVVRVNKWTGTHKIMEEDSCDIMYWCLFDNLPDNMLHWPKLAINMCMNDDGPRYITEVGW